MILVLILKITESRQKMAESKIVFIKGYMHFSNAKCQEIGQGFVGSPRRKFCRHTLILSPPNGKISTTKDFPEVILVSLSPSPRTLF